MNRRKIIQKIGWFFILFFIFLVSYAALSRYFIPDKIYWELEDFLYGRDWVRDQAPQYIRHSFLTFMHVVPGTFFLILGALQFSKKLRLRWLNLHRWLGRIYFFIGILMGITAFLLSIIMPVGGLSETVGIIFFDIIFLVSLFKAIYHVRRGEINKHREWMIRVFAIALGVGSIRVLYFIFLQTTSISVHQFFPIINWLGFSINLIVAEIWINITRVKNSSIY